MFIKPDKVFEGGDPQAGYKIEASAELHRLTVRMWGFWKDPALLPQFKTEILVCFTLLAARGPWTVFGDLRGYKVQMPDVADLILSLMKKAMTQKFTKCAVVQDSALVVLFIGGLTKMSGISLKFFETDAAAEAYLRQR